MYFKHGKSYLLQDNLTLISCYHPSPRNVNTKLISQKMMINLFKKAKNALASSGSKENPTEKVDEDQAVIEKEPPLTEIFVAMLKELEDEIQQAKALSNLTIAQVEQRGVAVETKWI